MFYSWIFLVGKFGLKVFLGGALIQVKICFDIQNKLKIRGSACVSWLLNVLLIFVLYHLMLSGILKVWKFGMGYFSRLVLGPGIFSGPEFYPHSIIPVT